MRKSNFISQIIRKGQSQISKKSLPPPRVYVKALIHIRWFYLEVLFKDMLIMLKYLLAMINQQVLSPGLFIQSRHNSNCMWRKHVMQLAIQLSLACHHILNPVVQTRPSQWYTTCMMVLNKTLCLPGSIDEISQLTVTVYKMMGWDLNIKPFGD